MDAKDIIQIYQDWVELEAKANRDKAVRDAQTGALRGGSAGCMATAIKSWGTCPRICIARSWGYTSTVPSDRHLMFDGGKANEALWDARFRAVLGDVVIPEGDPRSKVEWKLSSGRPITGSPDAMIMLVGEDGHKTGIEHKRISSAWTARKVSIKCLPKKDHFIQACHYMVASKIDRYILQYTQDVDFSCPAVPSLSSPAIRDLPPAERHKAILQLLWPSTSPVVEYRGEYPDKVRPHISAFDIDLAEDGYFWFRHHSQDSWTKSKITAQGIYDFYAMVDRQEQEGFLAAPPMLTSPLGDKGDNEKACTYCDLSDICKDKSLSFTSFKQRINSIVKGDITHDKVQG